MWLIATHNGITRTNTPRIDVNRYPAIKEHLDQFQPSLRYRFDQGATPYNLRDCTYMEDFSKQKIIYSEIVKSPQFYYDLKGYYFVEATAFILTGANLDYLIALLNSKVFSYIFKTFYAGGGLGSEGYRYKKAFLMNLPIPKYKGSTIQKQIINLCNTRNLQNHVEIDNEIEESIINLIGLSPNETNIINEEMELF